MELFIEDKASLLLRKVRDIITRENINGYLVGGYIRDALLGHPTQDIDIAIPHALEISRKLAKSLGGKCVVLSEANEIARVVLVDSTQSNQWHLDFSNMEGDIEENLSQRDFTIDAIAVNLRELKEDRPVYLIDPYQGQKDLEAGLIRVVSRTAFQKDPARLLRAVRLAAEHEFIIDEETEALLQAQSQLISQVAGERVREELCRLLAVSNSAPILYSLDRLGLLVAIFPELELTKGVGQPFEHYWDVFCHSIETVAALEHLLKGEKLEQDVALNVISSFPALKKSLKEVGDSTVNITLLKLDALLHDIAKPQTKSLETDGRARFLGHTKEGAEIAGRIMQRLRFSNKEIKNTQIIIESHLRPWQMGSDCKPTHRAIYRFFRDTGEVGIDIIILAMADFLATRGPDLNLEEWEKHCRMMEYILSEHEREEESVSPVKLVDGHDLINVFGIEPGPRIGQLLELLHEAQGIGEVKTREEALDFARRQIVLSQTTNEIIIKEEEPASVLKE